MSMISSGFASLMAASLGHAENGMQLNETDMRMLAGDHSGSITYRALNINRSHTTSTTLQRIHMPANQPSVHDAPEA
jgi:hypothetical protein